MLTEEIDPKTFGAMSRKSLSKAKTSGHEVCGALIREPDGVISLRPLKNLANEPAQWQIKTTWLSEIRRELKGSERKLVGTYHSHVGGYAYPSEKDLDYYPSQFFLMIFDTVLGRVGLWKPAIRNGIGRLHTVAVICRKPAWPVEDAISHALWLKEKFRSKAKRSTSKK